MIHFNFLPMAFYEWLIEKKNYAESTAICYKAALSKFLLTANNLYELSVYNDFIIKHCIKKRSTSYYNMLLKFIEFYDFEYEKEKGFIKSNDFKSNLKKDLIVPKEHKNLKTERKYLSKEQLIDLINYLESDKHKIIALIQFETGVRAGDVLRLKHGDIITEEYDGKEVLKLKITGKGKKRNVVYIHNKVVQDIILNHITTQQVGKEYYFALEPSYKFKLREPIYDNLIQLNYKRYWRDLKVAINMLGLEEKDFSSHDFRRCMARRTWTKYKDLTILQRLLNHEDPKNTVRYLAQSGLQNIDVFKELQDS